MRDATNRQTFLPPKYLDMNTIYSVGNPERKEIDAVSMMKGMRLFEKQIIFKSAGNSPCINLLILTGFRKFLASNTLKLP